MRRTCWRPEDLPRIHARAGVLAPRPASGRRSGGWTEAPRDAGIVDPRGRALPPPGTPIRPQGYRGDRRDAGLGCSGRKMGSKQAAHGMRALADPPVQGLPLARAASCRDQGGRGDIRVAIGSIPSRRGRQMFPGRGREGASRRARPARARPCRSPAAVPAPFRAVRIQAPAPAARTCLSLRFPSTP